MLQHMSMTRPLMTSGRRRLVQSWTAVFWIYMHVWLQQEQTQVTVLGLRVLFYQRHQITTPAIELQIALLVYGIVACTAKELARCFQH